MGKKFLNEDARAKGRDAWGTMLKLDIGFLIGFGTGIFIRSMAIV